MLDRYFKLPGLVSFFAIALFAVIPVSWFGVLNLENNLKNNTIDQLHVNIDAVEKSIHYWVHRQKAASDIWATHLDVRESILELTSITAREGWLPGDLHSAKALKSLRSTLTPVVKHMDYIGFVVIDKNGVNIAALLDEPIGKQNLLEKSDFVHKAMSGITTISLPFKASVSLPNTEGFWKRDRPTMFVASPVLDDDGSVAAVLSFRIRPETDFNHIFGMALVGETGETYAFNKDGLMISKSRFERDLKRTGLIKKISLLEIYVKDPGRDIIKFGKPKAQNKNWPLTVMAKSTIAGERSFNTDGYRSYRGKLVVGAGTWVADPGFGFISEIDVSEAFETYYFARNIVITIVGVSIVLFFILSFDQMRRRKEALAQVELIKKVNEELEEVQSELRTSMALQASISEIAPNAHILIDENGIILQVNPAVTHTFGYIPKELIGKNISVIMPTPHNEQHDGYLRKYLETGISDRIGKSRELVAVRKNGDHFPIMIYLDEARVDEKSIFVGIIEDITERKRFIESIRASEKKLNDITSTIGEGICVVDEKVRIIFTNPEAERLLGMKEEEMLGAHPHHLFHYKNLDGSPIPVEECTVVNSISNHKSVYGEEDYFLSKDGRFFPALYTVISIVENGELKGGILSFQDITERKKAESQLAERALLAGLTSDIGRSLTHSSEMQPMLQGCVKALVKHLGAAFARIWIISDDNTRLLLKASAGMDTNIEGEMGEAPVGENKVRAIAREKKPYLTNSVIGDSQLCDHEWAKQEEIVSFAGYPLIVGHEVVGGIALFSRKKLSETTNITLATIADEISVGISRINAIEKLQEMSFKDGLTGIANRRRFDETLDDEWKRVRRYEHPISLIMIDIDYFKQFNDTYGHQQGDDCLKSVAAAISHMVKRTADFVARYGGEEFVVILPNTDKESVYSVAESIRIEVENLEIEHNTSGVQGRKSITISSGVSTLEPSAHSSPSNLIELADVALYKAKSIGRNKVVASV